ncbi:MAG: NADH:ubiquinone reductase (Na(+)-transporting) subunit F [Prolixibacteraceae bacterium]|jgi:MocE subfamily Rieske [2Fe-2S] domain protein|nr:NADH:ubiquinone reductase (Na(+)-transporting) subunit F [Prolixibacteraceae bacterium]
MQEKQEIIRDYSLIGVETQKAIEMGLADAVWYQTPIARDKMRELLVRKDGPAIRDTLVWFGLIFGSAYLVFLLWGTWWVIFPYFIYSTLYASTSDSRWHESGHGTAFKTDWMNNLLYEVASFMVFRQSITWKWSHARHHSDTIIRGRDPEIAVPRPPDLVKVLQGFFGLRGSIPEARRIFKHALGKIDPEVTTYVPESEFGKVFFKARIYILIYLLVVTLTIIYGTILPLMYIGLPTLFGSWLMTIYGLTQHAGLQENVLDHRLNSRTVYMNRLHRYLYWNMNYHVEHHMFPLVPYHALPRLHELMKHDCPKPYNGIIETYKEIIPALLKQVKDPAYFVERKLPESTMRKANHDRNIFIGDPAAAVNGKIEVCRISDLPKGEVIRFDYDQKTYAVYHTVNNEFYATDGICTHGNAHLSEGVVIGDLIECTKHNGRFNLKDGSPKRIPVCVGINTFEVETDQGKVYLHLLNDLNRQDPSLHEGKTFRVVSNNNVTAFIKELVLEPANGSQFTFIPGEYIQLRIPPYELNFEQFNINSPFKKIWDEQELGSCFAKNSFYTQRNYSMATNPDSDQQLRFNVRIALPPDNNVTNAGIGSSYVFNLKPGEEVKLTGPYGDFHIKQSDREMVYIGGGAGMAPLRSHLSYLFGTAKTKRKVSFWYGARSIDDLFYVDYFENLQKNHGNFSFKIALSASKNQDSRNGYPFGFIHEVLFQKYLSKHEQPNEIEYYLCGPPALIEASLNMLKSLGVRKELIAFDEF